MVVIRGAGESTSFSEQVNGVPYAFGDVLGRPIVFRVIDRLKQHDIRSITVITDANASLWPSGTAANGRWVPTSSDQIWNAAEQIFADGIQDGADSIIVIRLGAYVEIDYNDLLQFHRDRHANVTSAVDADGFGLDLYVVGAAQSDDAGYLFRHAFREFRTQPEVFRFSGYVNRLSSPNHLRQLAIEGLMQRIQLAPEGWQVKPGVWVGRGAQIHKRARVLSPAFIGVGSRVRAAAVVTRCTALEHHSVVDCGTVVENVTTLPYTYLGAGLDVTHSVVGQNRIFNLKRGTEVEFNDPRLIGEASSHASLRALSSLVSLASFFPAHFLRGIFAPSHREIPASLPEAIAVPAAALDNPAPIQANTAPAVDAGEFPSQLAVARRYGNE